MTYGHKAKIIPLDSGCYCAAYAWPSVPHRSKSILHQGHGLILDMVQLSFHWQHLCGGWLVLAVHLRQILQLGCLCSTSCPL